MLTVALKYLCSQNKGHSRFKDSAWTGTHKMNGRLNNVEMRVMSGFLSYLKSPSTAKDLGYSCLA